MKKLRSTRGRTFLNRKKGMAAVEWEVSGEINKPYTDHRTKKPMPAYVEVNADFTVTDCNRQVSLDFDVWGAKDLEERWNKIETFEDQVTRFIEAYKQALEWAEINGLRDDS